MLADEQLPVRPALLEKLMRYFPAAAALTLFAALTASVGSARNYQPNARAAMLVSEGRSQLADDDVQGAIDSFEAALVVDPGYSEVYIELADAARQDGLQGKAIGYYREALARDPGNFAAISGEGEAMLEKGAIEKARLNLAQLESLCGTRCDETMELAAALEAGPPPAVLRAEVVTPDTAVTQN